MPHSVIGNNILYIEWNIQFCVGRLYIMKKYVYIISVLKNREIIYHILLVIYNLPIELYIYLIS